MAFVAFGERLAVQAYKAVCKNDILILQFFIRAYFIYAYHGFNEISGFLNNHKFKATSQNDENEVPLGAVTENAFVQKGRM